MDLPGISGIETVRKYSVVNKFQVVFTTSSREHAVEAFGRNAAHYLIKPSTQIMWQKPWCVAYRE